MSKFVVDIDKQQRENAQTSVVAPSFLENQTEPKKSHVLLKILKIFSIALILFLIVGGIGSYFYWQNLKKTPQYSLARLVDAARRDDQKAVDELIDTNQIVDDFMPQITDKAVELYGRGITPSAIQKMAQIAAPLMPAIKQRARAEVPDLIREKTRQFENYPFWTIAIGADRFLEIIREGDKSFVRSKLPNQALEVTLKRSGEQWQVVAIKDEVLARRVAEKIGQDLISVAQKGGVRKAGEQLGVSNLEEVLKKAEDIFK